MSTFIGKCQTQLGWKWVDGAKDDSKLLYLKDIVDVAADERSKAVWHTEDRIVVPGTPDLWDLTALERIVLQDTHITTFVLINFVHIVNLNTSEGTLIVGGATFNAWWMPFGNYTDTIEVPRNSPLLLGNRQDGWPVTGSPEGSSSSGDSTWDNILQVAASGAAVTYSIAIIGDLSYPTDSSSSSG